MLSLAWLGPWKNSADTLAWARFMVNARVRGANPLSARVLPRPFWVV
jgi:hypothetical protein